MNLLPLNVYEFLANTPDEILKSEITEVVSDLKLLEPVQTFEKDGYNRLLSEEWTDVEKGMKLVYERTYFNSEDSSCNHLLTLKQL